jgi:dTDP-glucose 4,6-dehydratase
MRKHRPKSVLVTGGAGFIGCNFVRCLLALEQDVRVVNLDLLTYAGSLRNIEDLHDNAHHIFVKGNITDRPAVEQLLVRYEIDTIVNFAAESHVDRSILGPEAFIQTNVVGTFTLLEAAKKVWNGRQDAKRFVHVSTDEVYGTLGPAEPAFSEATPYAPNSPYAASKASSDFLVRAYYRTYGLPAITTNCSNNYGPYQYPEKLIPLVVLNALTGKPLPVYGDGRQVRDWLYVEDHCAAIVEILHRGRPGETYNIGGQTERQNIEIVRTICRILDQRRPKGSRSYAEQITHVEDRLGHDRRYAIDAGKLQAELGWTPKESFETGIRKTVDWYLKNQDWVNGVMSEQYAEWIELNYSSRAQETAA